MDPQRQPGRSDQIAVWARYLDNCDLITKSAGCPLLAPALIRHSSTHSPAGSLVLTHNRPLLLTPTTMADIDYSKPVSTLLKEGTMEAHKDVEHSDAAAQLLSGKLEKGEYIRYLMVLYEIYECVRPSPHLRIVLTPLQRARARAGAARHTPRPRAHLQPDAACARSRHIL